jgi:hypothetical protein
MVANSLRGQLDLVLDACECAPLLSDRSDVREPIRLLNVETRLAADRRQTNALHRLRRRRSPVRHEITDFYFTDFRFGLLKQHCAQVIVQSDILNSGISSIGQK